MTRAVPGVRALAGTAEMRVHATLSGRIKPAAAPATVGELMRRFVVVVYPKAMLDRLRVR